jgi:hypothetical protein
MKKLLLFAALLASCSNPVAPVKNGMEIKLVAADRADGYTTFYVSYDSCAEFIVRINDSLTITAPRSTKKIYCQYFLSEGGESKDSTAAYDGMRWKP